MQTPVTEPDINLNILQSSHHFFFFYLSFVFLIISFILVDVIRSTQHTQVCETPKTHSNKL